MYNSSGTDHVTYLGFKGGIESPFVLRKRHFGGVDVAVKGAEKGAYFHSPWKLVALEKSE